MGKIVRDAWQDIFANSYSKPLDLLHDLGIYNIDVSADELFATIVPKPFVEKMQYGNANDPLLLQVLPNKYEFINKAGFSTDPLDEKKYNPLPGVLHKYKSRVLITFHSDCAINCRYCFRRHFQYGDNRIKKDNIIKIIDYIKQNPNINEVILSGGDPLMASDKQITIFVNLISKLPQLRRLRLHSRLPVVIPERITDTLVNTITSTHLKPVFVIHCNHPNEIDNNFNTHVKKLINSNVLVLNQGVLLKNINDNVDTLVKLSEKLFDAKILPYYLFLLDKVSGASHFDVSEKIAKNLIRDVAAKLPGYLVPKLSKETPGLASKDMWV